MVESSSTPRATPHIPSGGLFSSYAACTINAPASKVFEAILDTPSWPQWNTFVPSATVTKQPHAQEGDSRLAVGTCMTFKVSMTSTVSTISKEVVSIIENITPENRVGRICWSLDNSGMLTPSFMIRAERVNEIEDNGDGTCEYRTWETFAGPAARFVKWKYEQTLQERFEDWVRDLREFVEKDAPVRQT
ncbi:hypothetical protein LTR66_012525 [Elasticomyces elasticus]|nr:hypothetical protein LTR66_012525 [Elasticomyces elasticus]